MNKKVLVSILAMTSASTMTAWANANVDKLKTDNLEDWTKGSEGSDLKLEGEVIVSPDGADIIKTINLAPGTYRLVAGTLTNAKILFGKTELTKVEGEEYHQSEFCDRRLRRALIVFYCGGNRTQKEPGQSRSGNVKRPFHLLFLTEEHSIL